VTVITAVPREHVRNVWQMVSPWLDKAIERTHGRYHSVDILTSIIDGTASLWLAMRDKEIIGSLVFTVSVYPSGLKVGRLDYLAGKDRDEWFDQMWDTLKEYGKREGCLRLEMMARPGTGLYAKKYGSKVLATFYEYDLTKEENDDGR